MRKIAILFMLIILATSVSALSFEGQKQTFQELNLNTKELTPEDNCITFNYNDWTILKENKGILGILLHLEPKGIDITDRKTHIAVKINDELIKHKSFLGVNIALTYKLEEIQSNYLFVSLEEYRNQDDANIEICSYFDKTASIKIYNDSEIGSYELPYFECSDCFVKRPTIDKYKVGQKTPISVDFKNIGYNDANVTVFYDSEFFKKWFRLRDGQPIWEGILKPNENNNIRFNFVPEIEENFIISPAVLNYTVNNYIFTTYSNPIIVGTVPYLNTISCQHIITERNYAIGDTATLEVVLYNDYGQDKEVEVILEKNGVPEVKTLKINAQETAKTNFYITENKEDVVDLKLSLQKADLNQTKECSSDTLGFTKDKHNYLPYIILLLILVAIGIFVYYYYFL